MEKLLKAIEFAAIQADVFNVTFLGLYDVDSKNVCSTVDIGYEQVEFEYMQFPISYLDMTKEEVQIQFAVDKAKKDLEEKKKREEYAQLYLQRQEREDRALYESLKKKFEV
jgi:hypothetical protein